MGRHIAPPVARVRKSQQSPNGMQRSYISVRMTATEIEHVRQGASKRGTSMARWIIDRSLYQTTRFEREAVLKGNDEASRLFSDLASVGAMINDGARQANTDSTLISEWHDLVQWATSLVGQCEAFSHRYDPAIIDAYAASDDAMVRRSDERTKYSPQTTGERSRLNLRVTEEERLRVLAGATMAGMSQSSWILYKGLAEHQGVDRGTVQDFISAIQNIVRQLVGIGTNLKQVVAVMRTDKARVEQWQELSLRCRQLCRELNAIADHWTRYV